MVTFPQRVMRAFVPPTPTAPLASLVALVPVVVLLLTVPPVNAAVPPFSR